MPMRRPRAQRIRYCRIVGKPLSVVLEPAVDPERIDHVWVTLDVGEEGEVKAVINTLSLRNKVAGFDPRIWVGMVKTPFDSAPNPGIFSAEGLDYDEIAAEHEVKFEPMTRSPLELLLCEKLRLANLIEAWGDFFDRGGPGLHQIHSRRASCAVTEDLRGRDGAFRCYDFETKTAELYLLKFCGQ